MLFLVNYCQSISLEVACQTPTTTRTTPVFHALCSYQELSVNSVNVSRSSIPQNSHCMNWEKNASEFGWCPNSIFESAGILSLNARRGLLLNDMAALCIEKVEVASCGWKLFGGTARCINVSVERWPVNICKNYRILGVRFPLNAVVRVRKAAVLDVPNTQLHVSYKYIYMLCVYIYMYVYRIMCWLFVFSLYCCRRGLLVFLFIGQFLWLLFDLVWSFDVVEE